MIALGAIANMAVAALKILWDGRMQASSQRVVTGWPLKLLGAALLLAGPLSYIGEAALAWSAGGNTTAPSIMQQREILFWSLLLGPPALAALVAILLPKPTVGGGATTES